MKKIIISIIDYKGKKNTLLCLESLEKITIPKDYLIEVVVINNYPQEELHIENKYKTFSLTVIQNTENTGFSGGHNKGIAYAEVNKAEYIVILNNDTLVSPTFLKELVTTAHGKQNVGILVPKIYFTKGSEFHKNRYKKSDQGKVFWYAGGKMDWKNVFASHRGVDEVDTGQYDKVVKTEFATGCCMFIPVNVFENVGGFDERYFLYLEDLDLNMRVKKAKYDVWYIPQSVIWHTNAGSTGGSGSSLQDYYTTRNRLLFGFSYASFRTKLALIRESMRQLRSGREWQKKGVADFYLRKFYRGSYNP